MCKTFANIICNSYSLITQKHNPMRWITWLANRWRAQLTAWINVICRTHWSSISWTHIAVTDRFRDYACLRVGLICLYVKSVLALLLGRFKFAFSHTFIDFRYSNASCLYRQLALMHKKSRAFNTFANLLTMLFTSDNCIAFLYCLWFSVVRIVLRLK